MRPNLVGQDDIALPGMTSCQMMPDPSRDSRGTGYNGRSGVLHGGSPLPWGAGNGNRRRDGNRLASHGPAGDFVPVRAVPADYAAVFDEPVTQLS